MPNPTATMSTLIVLDCLPSADTPDRQALSSLARSLALHAASQLMHLPLRSFSMDPDAPPCLLLEGRPAPLGFSVSHSGAWVAVAVSASRPLGLDLEHCRHALPGELDELLSPAEAAWLRQHQPAQSEAERFYHAWTLKEALGKCYGRHGEGHSPLLHRVHGYAGHLALPEHELLLAICAPARLHCKLQLGSRPASVVALNAWPQDDMHQ